MGLARHFGPDLISQAQLPQIKIKFNNEVAGQFINSESAKKVANLDDEINHVLEVEKAEPVTLSGSHALIWQENPFISHHPDWKHGTFWANQRNTNRLITPWGSDSIQRFSSDKKALSTADRLFEEAQDKNPLLNIYHTLGVATPEQAAQARRLNMYKGGRVAPRGPSSVERLHVHFSEEVFLGGMPIVEDLSSIQWLEGDSLLDDKYLLPLFINQAGRVGLDVYKEVLKGFGTRIEYTQVIGKEVKTEIPRVLFCFESWDEALRKSLELQKGLLAKDWMSFAHSVSLGHVMFAGELVRNISTCVPGCGLISPSQQNRQEIGLDTKFRWVVDVFSTLLPTCLFSNGGLVWHKNPNNQVKRVES